MFLLLGLERYIINILSSEEYNVLDMVFQSNLQERFDFINMSYLRHRNLIDMYGIGIQCESCSSYPTIKINKIK